MSLGLRESGSVWIIPPEVSVSNGDHITLIKEDRGVIGDGGTIELGVVGLTQRSNVDHPIGDLNLELCMLSADSRKVDLDVTSHHIFIFGQQIILLTTTFTKCSDRIEMAVTRPRSS